MGLNDDIASSMLRFKVGALRKGSQISNELADIINEAEDSINARISADTGHQARSAAVIARNTARTVGDRIMSEVDSYAEARLDKMLAEFKREYGLKLDYPSRKPSLSFLRGNVSKFMEDAATSAYDRARQVVSEEQDTKLTVARLRAHAKTIARSGANAAHNAAVLSLIRANKNVFGGVMALATLDNRTTDICNERHGGAWNLETMRALPWSSVEIDFPGRPPWHFNCRTTLSPLMLDQDVPTDESLDREAWLSSVAGRESLGDERVSLYEQGKLTLSQLLDV